MKQKNQNFILFTLLINISLFYINCEQTEDYEDEEPLTLKTENVDLYTEKLEDRKCKTRDRIFYEDCKCIDGKYDNGVDFECQMCPYPCLQCDNADSYCMQSLLRPFISFEHFIDEEKVKQLEKTIVEDLHLYEPDHPENIFAYSNFRSDHGKNIFFTEKINWPEKWAMKKGSKNYAKNFKIHRKYRGSEYYFEKQPLFEIAGIRKFLEEIDLFEYTGNAFLITNNPDDPGSRHTDHNFQDIVSEHMWLRTNPDKQFYTEKIKDKSQKRYHMMANLIFFDDQGYHSISKTYAPSFSIRIDGKFKPWVRKYLAEHFDFFNEKRRQVFINQKNMLRHPDDSLEAQYETA